jgi:hypothetical protein
LQALPEKTNAKIEFVASGQVTATLDNVTDSDGKLLGKLITADGSDWPGTNVNEIRVHPIHASLLPVPDRGVTYQPPKEHMGVRLPNDYPFSVDKSMLEYLDKMLREADHLVSTQS